MTIQPIETAYKGYRFRSRLEARWAVFFDVLEIAWEYEKEGYDLGEAGWYLPDFWLPQVNMWAEVKAATFTRDEVNKCIALAEGTGFSVLMLEGLPDNRFYKGTDTCRGWNEETRAFDLICFVEYAVTDYHSYFRDENRFYSMPGCSTPAEEGVLTDTTIDGYKAARSARFEHGENGT